MLFASPDSGFNWDVTDAQGKDVSPFNSTGEGEYVEYTVKGEEPFTVTTRTGRTTGEKSISGLTQKDLVIASGKGANYTLSKTIYFKDR